MTLLVLVFLPSLSLPALAQRQRWVPRWLAHEIQALPPPSRGWVSTFSYAVVRKLLVLASL